MSEASLKRSSRMALHDKMSFIDWKPENLAKVRIQLGLTQYDIASALCVTQPTVARVEHGDNCHFPLVQLYGIILERYWAYRHGYMPAFRKIGEDEYLNEDEVMKLL